MIISLLYCDIEEKDKLWNASLNMKSNSAHILFENNNNENIENEIIKREKNQKLTKNQLAYLKAKINSSQLSISELSRKYYLCPTTLRKIKNLSVDQLNLFPLRNFQNVNSKSSEIIEQEIVRFYNKTKTPFISKDVQKHLSENLNNVPPLNKIVNIMRNDLKLTYKRCLSRPNSIDLERIKLLRFLFSVNFVSYLNQNTLIWNIDECTFSRSTKTNYSWSIKGYNKEVQNCPFVGNIYMILAILSNGWWFWLTSKDTIDSKIFIYFMNSLNSWIESHDLFNYKELIYMLDNCPSHKSKGTLKMLKEQNHKVCFLPAYSPNLAPIELWFSFLKQKLREISNKENVRLESIESQNKLLIILRKLTKELIIKYYMKFHKELKLCLNYFN